MMTCQRLSDRMAQVAGGATSWTADETAHLTGCADCAAEWRLMAAATQLGARRPALEPARIAKRLHQQLATARADVAPMTRRRPIRWVVGLAAAAALILAVRMAVPGGGPGPAGTKPGVGVLSELDELSGQELVAVLEVFEVDRPAPSVEAPGLGDLTSDELAHLLQNWRAEP